MKRMLRLAGNTNRYFTLVFIAVILGGVAFVKLSWPPYAVGGDALLESARTTGLTSVGVQANSPVPDLISPPFSLPASSEEPIQITAQSTYTTFLPFVSRVHWMCPGSSFGIQIYTMNPVFVSKIIQAGACWVRIPLYWSQIEPVNTTPQNYQWSEGFDEGLARLSASNIKTILTVSDNPSWASTYHGGPVDKVDIGELVEFAVAAVNHYGAQPYNVKYWEFYNEPDNGSEAFDLPGYGFFGNQPEAYADMLAAVYQPIKTADPQAQVVMGGLAYDYWPEDGGHFVKDFLDGVLQNGGGDFFDVMNFHYYASFGWRWNPYGKGVIGKATYLRDKLAAYGYDDKPFICTESGTYSKAGDPVESDRQSRYVVQLFARGMAANLDSTTWFMLTDDPVWKYGLLTADLSPKPSYQAFTTVALQLPSAHYVRTWNSAETGSEQIEAYEFSTIDESMRTITAWTNDNLSHAMSVTAQRVVVVDMYGSQTTINDADDGKADGQVRVTISPSPVYLRVPRG
jgi:hypothetical protein